MEALWRLRRDALRERLARREDGWNLRAYRAMVDLRYRRYGKALPTWGDVTLETPDIRPEDVPKLQRALEALAAVGAPAQVWDGTYKTLYLEGTLGPVKVVPLRDVPPGEWQDPDNVLAHDGFGARVSFRFDALPEGLEDPGEVVVDALHIVHWSDDGLELAGSVLRLKVGACCENPYRETTDLEIERQRREYGFDFA